MIPRELVASARIPDGGELRCYRHDNAFLLLVDGIELMNSRVHGSEEELAELTVARMCPAGVPTVLVGGLGMGFTLARLLALLPLASVVEVSELVPEVVTWNRELFGHCAAHPLQDGRVRVEVGDVGARIAAGAGRYDALLLDVDNGPDGLVRDSNNQLYGEPGLRAARRALRPGGVLAVWSSRGSHGFLARLRHCGFTATEHRVRARRTRGPVRTIWVGVAP